MDLSGFTKARSDTPGITFPLLLQSFSVDGDVHTVTGQNLSSPSREVVTVYLRPRKKKEGGGDSGFTRPEVLDFVTDTMGDAIKSGNRASIEAASANPLTKVFTPVGGILLVESAYHDTKRNMWSASWLRSLSKSADDAVVESLVFARLNNPYKKKDSESLVASVDVVYPDQATHVGNHGELSSAMVHCLRSHVAGTPAAVVRLVSADDGMVVARSMMASKVKSGDDFVWDDPVNVVDRFWDSLDDDFRDQLVASIDAGSVKASVFPGVRYHYVGKGLDNVLKAGDEHARRFQMGEGEDNGFLPCTVSLRAFDGEAGMYPVGVYPIRPFDDKPVALKDLV